jgi:hypothetical protein
MGHRVSTNRSAERTLLQLTAVLLLACWVAVGSAAPADAAPSKLIKVFVVADPSQTLQSIAAGTMNDPGRASEIFTLNRGRTQPDGGALNDPNEQLHPGWILRLPQDASGPDVKLAKDNSSGNTGTAAGQTGGTQSGTVVSFPLPAALAVIGSILLALLTTAIVARRRMARWFAFVGRAFAALGAPARRRRQIVLRRSLGERFAADAGSVRRAYDTLGEVATTANSPVYAVSVDEAGSTVWLAASDQLGAPWQHIDSTRWRRPAAAWAGQTGPAQVQAARSEQLAACLVRVGTGAQGEPFFLDLSRLDGVLSVTGDRAVARDTVQNLLAEIARVRPNTPVLVLPTADDAAPVAIPAGLTRVGQVPVPPPGGNGPHGTVRGAAARRPVGGLVVTAGTPSEREAAEILALCGTRGGGWTGLVCGPVIGGAHWRWHAAADGSVDIPVLGVELTVPA